MLIIKWNECTLIKGSYEITKYILHTDIKRLQSAYKKGLIQKYHKAILERKKSHILNRQTVRIQTNYTVLDPLGHVGKNYIHTLI